jgi:phage tail sheath protein FI
VAEFLSPGVFIEEVPSTVQTIAAVSTSNLGIIGFTTKGPVDEATLVTSPDQFFRTFGELSPDTFTGLSVLAFFANGGRRAFVVRVVPSDAVTADADLQSKTYSQQIETGDGSTVNFTKTDLNTTLKVNGGLSPIIAYNGLANAGILLQWRSAGAAIAAERVKDITDGTTDLDLVDSQAEYGFTIDPTQLPALAEEDWEQLAVVPGTVTLSFDPDGGGARTLVLANPTSGSVSSTPGDGATTDSETVVVFDYATGRGSILFGASDINDVPDASVVAASLTLAYTPTTTSRQARDDGSGNIIQITTSTIDAGGTNTIDYNDGSYDFDTTVGATPHDGAPILATYFIEAFDLNPVSPGEWANNIKLQVQGNANYFDASTQTYTKFDVNVTELNSQSGLFEVVESYEALDFSDSSAVDYFVDVINELSDLIEVTSPAGDEAPGTLNGRSVTQEIGAGGANFTPATFGAVDLLGDDLRDQGFAIGPRSVVLTATDKGLAATGTITTVAEASLIDGETFTLDDGVNPAITFEFDVGGGGVVAGNVAVVIAAMDTADVVRDAIITAVNGEAAAGNILIRAADGGAATVDLTHARTGVVGNQAITDTVADAGFVVVGMAGGTADTTLTVNDDGTGALTGDIDPTYATTVTVSGTDIPPNEINYALGWANFQFNTTNGLKGGTLVEAAFYTDPEESVREDQFGDTDKQFTDTAAVPVDHYAAGSDGTFTSSTYSRTQFSDPTLQSGDRGLYALNKVDEIMQVIIPDFAGDVTVTGDLLDYAAARAALPSGGDRFIILAVPVGSDAQEAVDWFRFDLGRFSKFAALYWPWIRVADPLADGRPLLMPPLGHVAGVYARTDTTRNVGKAPGGTVDGALNFLIGLETEPTQGDRNFVYPNKINPLISSPQTGLAVWGVRTIAIESEWRYIQARRLFMFLEKSVFNATGWIVFENNGPGLWSRIKGQLDGFLSNLFNEGLFFGASPTDAYFVVVDETNNDAASIEAGQVIIDIGVAPNRPAEFVRFRFQQKTISG